MQQLKSSASEPPGNCSELGPWGDNGVPWTDVLDQVSKNFTGAGENTVVYYDTLDCHAPRRDRANNPARPA